MNIPNWLVNGLVAIGGWKVLERLSGPVLKALYEHWTEKQDEPVWAIVRVPVTASKISRAGYDSAPVTTDIDCPHSLESISSKLNRSNSSVLSSLKRLEKRGKVNSASEDKISKLTTRMCRVENITN